MQQVVIKEKDKKGNPKFIAKKEWRATTKPGELFLHVFNWPKQDLTIPPVEASIASATFLTNPDQTLHFDQTDDGVTIKLPDEAPDSPITVIRLKLTK